MTVLVIQDFISLDYGREFMLGYQICIQQSYRPPPFYFGTKSFNLRSATPPDNLLLQYHDIVQYPMIITYDFPLDMEIHQILPEARDDEVAMHF